MSRYLNYNAVHRVSAGGAWLSPQLCTLRYANPGEMERRGGGRLRKLQVEYSYCTSGGANEANQASVRRADQILAHHGLLISNGGAPAL
ncbi:hypothetical protein O181_062975 [Austropuccinia psidii MF-1]|uniref:Uncharacterized protein n=1 Tax=Austropuccinia psidii MF-1 TaxID=1389203 RepID=A0A9Q3EHY9_9BASI|nr:hypothetical protein [Austropuccinia psidii MF-1]